MKIEECANDWLNACIVDGLERATIQTYRGHVNNHIVPRLGNEEIELIQTPTLEKFRLEMLVDNSPAVTKKVLISLRAIFKRAQLMGHIVINMSLPVTMKGSNRHKKSVQIPSKAEIRELIRKAPDSHKPFIITAIFTGMRSSELRGLRWQHVNFDSGIIRVESKVDCYGRRGSPKSPAAHRNIPMTPMVRSTLMEWQKSCPKGEEGLVFPNTVGKVQSHTNLCNRVLYPLYVKVGITDENGKARFGTHGLRHAAASLFIDQGWTAKKVQTIMGHKKIEMTFDTYGHLFEDTADDLSKMEKLEKELFAA